MCRGEQALLFGSDNRIACDLLDNKLAYAKNFGATHTINAKLGDVAKRVQALTGGLGVDAAFDAIGGEATALQALNAVAPGGHAVLVGIPAFAVRAPISPFNMVFADLYRCAQTPTATPSILGGVMGSLHWAIAGRAGPSFGFWSNILKTGRRNPAAPAVKREKKRYLLRSVHYPGHLPVAGRWGIVGG